MRYEYATPYGVFPGQAWVAVDTDAESYEFKSGDQVSIKTPVRSPLNHYGFLLTSLSPIPAEETVITVVAYHDGDLFPRRIKYTLPDWPSFTRHDFAAKRFSAASVEFAPKFDGTVIMVVSTAGPPTGTALDVVVGCHGVDRATAAGKVSLSNRDIQRLWVQSSVAIGDRVSPDRAPGYLRTAKPGEQGIGTLVGRLGSAGLVDVDLYR